MHFIIQGLCLYFTIPIFSIFVSLFAAEKHEIIWKSDLANLSSLKDVLLILKPNGMLGFDTIMLIQAFPTPILCR